MAKNEEGRKTIYTVCNAGKERSRGLASAIDQYYHGIGEKVSVIARGSFGLGKEDEKKSMSTKYGWTPPPGFVEVMAKGGLEFHTYESQVLTEEEAKKAHRIVAVDPLVASRVMGAFPDYAGKVVNALEILGKEHNPFPDFLGGASLPDAFAGYLADNVRKVLHSAKDPAERVRAVERTLERRLGQEEAEFARNYDPRNPTNPNEVMKIPAGLRHYLGHALDSEAAYLAEAKVLKEIGEKLAKGGHLD